MARSVTSLLDSWRQDPDLGGTLQVCQRLVRLCSKPGAVTHQDNKIIDGFCGEAHQQFANSGDLEVLLAIAGLSVTVGSLDRAEQVLDSVPSAASDDIRVRRIRGKIHLHKGVQGARGAPAGSAAHLLTGITHNAQLRTSRASGAMRAVVPPSSPGSPSATPSSNPGAAPRRSFTPSPFANVPEQAPLAPAPYSAPPSAPYSAPPAQSAAPYSAPPSAPYSAPPSAPYSAPPSAPYSAPPAQSAAPYSAPPAAPYSAPPAQSAAPYAAPPAQDESNESATKAHQYSPLELLALVTNPNAQPLTGAVPSQHTEAIAPPWPPDDDDAGEPRTQGFDFSQGLPEEAFRPDQAGPHDVRTIARQSPLEDPDGPTRGRDVPEYLMRLAAEAAGGEVDQDGPTRGREIPDYLAQLAAEAAGGDDSDDPTRGREIPPHLARAAAAAAGADDEGPTKGIEIPEHVSRMAARASQSQEPDSTDELLTRQRIDPEDGINTQLRPDPEEDLSTQRAHIGRPHDTYTGDDEMRSIIAAADAHDEMRSIIAAADAYIDGHHAEPSAPPRNVAPVAAGRPMAADPSSLRPSPIPKPPSRGPDAGPASHAQPTRPDPIELAPISRAPVSHTPVSRTTTPSGHQAVDLNVAELEAPRDERSGKAGWLVFALLVLGAAAGGFFLRPILSGERSSSATPTPAVKAPTIAAALSVPGMLRGGRAGLGEADAALNKAEQERGRTPEVTLARARYQLLRWLELGGPTSDLGQAVTEAKESGVDAGSLAFAEVVTALASSDPALPGVLTRLDGQSQRQSDAYYLLAAGVALEQRGSEESISRFRAAIGSEPGLHIAEMYLVRAMLLYGDRTEAEKRLKSLDASGAHKDRVDALAALIWLHRKAEGTETAPPPSLASDADIPFSVAWIPASLAYLAEPEATSRRGHLRRALEAIHTPSEATILAKLAVSRGDSELALAAAKKATATWTAPEALRALGDAALLSSDLDALTVDAATGPIALELAAVRAYERGDMATLSTLAKQTGAPPGVRLRVERVFGLRPLADSDLSTLRNPQTVGGQLVALDALLDSGELVAAREIVDAWPTGFTSALQAHRLARLLRYEGEVDAAIEAIEKAGDTGPAIAERVMIAAESPRRAAHILKNFDPKALPAGPYLNVYLVARAGSRQSAAILMGREKPPTDGDALSVHVAAALAHGAMRNTKAQDVVQKLLDAYPDNPDVRLAALGVALDLPKLSKDAKKGDAPKKGDTPENPSP